MAGLNGLHGERLKAAQDKGRGALLANFAAAASGRGALGVTAHNGLRATLCAEAALEAMQSGKAERV